MQQGSQARMVAQVCLDQWGLQVNRVLLVDQAPLARQVWENPVNQEFQVAEDPLVLQEPLVRKESKGQLVLLDIQVLLVLWAQLVHRVQEDSREMPDQKDPKATMAW